MQKATISHDEIRSWIESKKGKPAIIDHPLAKADTVGIRVNFPGEKDEELLDIHSTRNISWSEFFTIFDEEQLVFVYDDEPKSLDPTDWYHYERRVTYEIGRKVL